MVGLFQIELYIPGAFSLKEKRYVIKSLKERIRNKYNVSIAELDGNDQWQRSLIGVAMVSNETQLIESCFTKILNFLDGDGRIEVIDRRIEYF